MNNTQFSGQIPSSSVTMGQLFDKTVDKLMKDSGFRSSMDSNKTTKSWGASFSSSYTPSTSKVPSQRKSLRFWWSLFNLDYSFTFNCFTLFATTRPCITSKRWKNVFVYLNVISRHTSSWLSWYLRQIIQAEVSILSTSPCVRSQPPQALPSPRQFPCPSKNSSLWRVLTPSQHHRPMTLTSPCAPKLPRAQGTPQIMMPECPSTLWRTLSRWWVLVQQEASASPGPQWGPGQWAPRASTSPLVMASTSPRSSTLVMARAVIAKSAGCAA